MEHVRIVADAYNEELELKMIKHIAEEVNKFKDLALVCLTSWGILMVTYFTSSES